MALEEILAHKRTEVARRKDSVTLESMLDRCVRSDRSLSQALRAGRPGYILEIKFASPSGGQVRPGEDLEPILESYGRHADAVSVLTDARFFGGSLERMRTVRERLHQPVLCKDFILEPFQVAEARLHGADAVLLILAAVDDQTWRHCADLASRLGMEILTEIHNEAEAARAVGLGARIVGINHRDLRSLAVDLGVSARLSPLIPADRLVVAESGIETNDDVAALRPHADAFLVGSALMRQPDLDAAVRQLVYGRTKICGLTTPEAARAARRAGATHGGLMFAAASPRRISGDRAEEIRRAEALRWVGVFADQDAGLVAHLAARLALDAVQLHGAETAADIAALRGRLPEACQVWKAERVRARIPHIAESGADRLLLDGWVADQLGGTGARSDWSLLRTHPERGAVILAGGLTPENVERAAALRPWALDVSSGVESGPGRKDPGRLAAFFAARRRVPGRGDPKP